MSTATVILRNGTEVPAALVGTTTIALGQLFADAPIALYELTEFCRDPQHELFGNAGGVLERYGLMQGGRVHDAVRDIVLCAVVGADFDLTLQSPVATAVQS